MTYLDYLPRLVEPRLAALIPVFPVVVVTGARQTGKSTLVRRSGVLEGLPYLTLDDVDLRDAARRDPEIFLDRGDAMILDEVQRAPDLLLAVKRRVDEAQAHGASGRECSYVLTGSSDLLLQKDVAESLAGRAGYLALAPLTRREQQGLASAGVWDQLLILPPDQWPDLLRAQEAPEESWQDAALRGGYPVPAHMLRRAEERREWFGAYAATYLERDLRQLSAVENLADMRRLMAALCLRVGGLLNQAEVGRDISVPASTVQRFVNLLEVSYQLLRVPAYTVNRTRRLIKAPKVYWSDTGLALHLSGETSPRGAHLENLVLADLTAWAGASPHRPSVLHWRTAGGTEVDFVVEAPGRLLPMEVKAARRVTHRDARHLRTFLDEYPEAPAALVIYDGTEVFWVERGVLAAPWWTVM